MSSHAPRKQPKQARSAVTQDIILQAAAHILETDGMADFNTNRIAEIAGVSIGSLYQYFPSKQAILAELIRRNKAQFLAELAQSTTNAGTKKFDDTLETLIDAVVRFQFDRPKLARHLKYLEATLPLDEEARQKDQRISQLVGNVLRTTQNAKLSAQQIAILTQDIIAIVRGIVDAAAITKEGDKAALKARVMNAVIGYLDRSEELPRHNGHQKLSQGLGKY